MKTCNKCGSAMMKSPVGPLAELKWLCQNPMCNMRTHGGTIHKSNDFRGSHGGRTHTTVVSDADEGETRVSFDQKDGVYTNVHPQSNKGSKKP